MAGCGLPRTSAAQLSAELAAQNHHHMVGGISLLDGDLAGFKIHDTHLRASQARPSAGRSAKVGTDFNSSTEGEGAAASRLARVSMSDFAEVLVHELYSHGAFADARSDALNGTMAHVANSEDARNIGFQ